ncbi:MAG: ABC transporter ATP-binding protein [Chloroflexi bacterium]|nr:ABC transporter ATP-binding protein [Chloroflexota bacterium]MDE2701739.1 ABC transporter ATP-binding protein [Chloroflexota bacterium]
MRSSPLISVDALGKSFGARVALDGISLEVADGGITGLLGPNGAGKTTFLRILTTILPADSGDVSVGGVSVSADPAAVRAQLGVCPQDLAIYEDLTGQENVAFFGRLSGLSRRQARASAARQLELVGLADRASDRAGTYSGGMKRRLNIAVALVANPRLLLLDEPTVGVDPQSRNRIFEVVESLRDEGMTIVYTTHYMEEADRLCDQVVVIDLGRIVAQGTPRELKSGIGDPEEVTLEQVFLGLTGRSLRE